MAWLPHVLAFLLFPTGRTARRAFAITFIASLVAFFGLAILWVRFTQSYSQIAEATRLVPFVAMWIKCAATSRRLHDINITGWLTLPGIAVILIPFAIRFLVPALHIPYDYSVPFLKSPLQLGYAATIILTFLGDIVLCFVPGSKGANAFGPPPGRPAVAADTLF